MKCRKRKRHPETIQMNRYRKTNARLIVCARLNSDFSKRVEIRADSQVSRVNHPDARSRLAIYVNVQPRHQLDNVRLPKTWRNSRVAVDRTVRILIRNERETSWLNEKTHWLTASTV